MSPQNGAWEQAMKRGDIVKPLVSRFPLFDPKGVPTEIHAECVGQTAEVLKVERCAIDVQFTDTAMTWIYRPDEVTFHCSKEEWRDTTAGSVKVR
jgi:hypothetical protein